MMLVLLAMLAAGAYAQTVGSLLGEYQWIACKLGVDDRGNKEDYTACPSDLKTWEWWCMNYGGWQDGAERSPPLIDVWMGEYEYCEATHSAANEWIFNVRRDKFSYQRQVCMYKCEKIQKFTYLDSA